MDFICWKDSVMMKFLDKFEIIGIGLENIFNLFFIFLFGCKKVNRVVVGEKVCGFVLFN